MYDYYVVSKTFISVSIDSVELGTCVERNNGEF